MKEFAVVLWRSVAYLINFRKSKTVKKKEERRVNMREIKEGMRERVNMKNTLFVVFAKKYNLSQFCLFHAFIVYAEGAMESGEE